MYTYIYIFLYSYHNSITDVFIFLSIASIQHTNAPFLSPEWPDQSLWMLPVISSNYSFYCYGTS